ncbi:hypothetical protein [Pontibacter sp. SGAir0037]|uniref:hypothetical protein n=1 Tax=Pontibacter sp. SGAir0037 TaxID=2571030 RepID=UPI00143DF0B7|nr:hypothetical protein [Pontibacter sp. SGAir0037]
MNTVKVTVVADGQILDNAKKMEVVPPMTPQQTANNYAAYVEDLYSLPLGTVSVSFE